MSWFGKLVYWLTGSEAEARKALERQGVTASIELPTGYQGDATDFADGRVSGGLVWPLDRGSHGMVSFLTSDLFLAHYDAKAKRCYMLDRETGERHQGAKALVLDENLFVMIGKDRSGPGIVVRAALLGEDGIYRNVFLHSMADLIAHHLPPDQPLNSSLVHDPDAEGRAGGLHYPLRVREWVRRFCQGQTATAQDPLFAPLFNLGRNGDGTPAYGAAHWDRADGTLSDEGGGPLANASDGNHRLGQTNDATINQGGLAIEALYGPVSGLYGPKELVPVQWQDGAKGPHIMRVEHRPDLLAKHRNYCGKEAPLVLKWQTWAILKPEGPPPPPSTPPESPPPAPPNGPPTDNPPPGYPTVDTPIDRQRFPSIIPRDRTQGEPSASTPEEVEAPSHYGHAKPDIPDGFERQIADASKAVREWWGPRYGYSEGQFAEQPIVAHTVFVPVYEAAAPNTGGGERWPAIKSQHAEFDADGNRVRPAFGDGSMVLVPGNMIGADVFGTGWPASPDDVALIVLAGNNGTTTVDGRFGIGKRVHTSPFVASGFELRLNTSPSAATPDLVVAGKNGSAADASAGRVQFLNPIALPAEALPGSPLTGQLAIDSGASNALKWWDGSAWQTAGGGGSHPDPHLLGDGSITDPTYSFASDPVAGMWLDAATTPDEVVLNSVDGTDVLRVANSGVKIVGLASGATGLELTPVAANPGGTGANTIWIDDGTNYDSGTLVFGDATTPIVALGEMSIGDPGFEQGGVTVNGTTYDANLKLNDYGGSRVAGAVIHRHSTTYAPAQVFARSNSDTSAHTVVTSGQVLGEVYFAGWDGTDYALGAKLSVEVDGTPGNNDMPGRFVFSVSPDGSHTPAEAMRITSEKYVRIASLLTSVDEGAALTMKPRTASAGNPGGSLTLEGGAAGIGGTGGSVTVNAGFGTGGSGTLYLGTLATTAVNISATTLPTNVAGSLSVAEQLYLTGDGSGAGGNDVDPGSNARYRLTSGAALTGFTGGADGRILIVENATGADHTLTHDATSTAANRLYCPGSADITIPANGTVILCYSSTDSRWRVASIAQGGGSGGGLTHPQVMFRGVFGGPF